MAAGEGGRLPLGLHPHRSITAQTGDYTVAQVTGASRPYRPKFPTFTKKGFVAVPTATTGRQACNALQLNPRPRASVPGAATSSTPPGGRGLGVGSERCTGLGLRGRVLPDEFHLTANPNPGWFPHQGT